MAQSTMTQTKTTSATGTAVMVATAVLVATVVGTTIGITQWQQRAALVIDDLDNINIEVGGGDYTKLTVEDDEAFGGAVANVGDLNGDGHDDLVIADVDYDVTDAGLYQQGRIYGYNGSDTALSTTADWTIAASSGYDYADFGQSVDGAGDVNGDGFDDLIVGAPQDGEHHEGMVYGYYGSATGVDTTTASWSVAASEYSEGMTGEFGYIIAGIGDVNADGFDDVAIYDGELTDAADNDMSRLFVYNGSSTGLSTTASWRTDVVGDLENLGMQPMWLDGADVNGDGYADMLYGNSDNGNGSILAFYGSATGFALRPDFRFLSRTSNSYGNVVAAAGDVNSDGYDDVIVGAPTHTRSAEPEVDQEDEGMIVVYYGSSTGLSFTNKWQVESNMADAWLGVAATTALDVNADGYDDILVTAPNYPVDGTASLTGRAYIYGGSATGMVRAPLGITGAEAYADIEMRDFGMAVASSETFIGSSGVDLVVTVGSLHDDETYGPAVLVYPDVSL